MKKNSYFFLFMTAVALLSGSCSSTKGSKGKGGGWYKNRNVYQIDLEKEASIVYQSEEITFNNKAHFEQ